MRFFIYETDLRQITIGESLEEKGFEKVTLEEIDFADVVILPFVNVENSVKIDEDFFKTLKKGVKVYTGAKNTELKDKFVKKNISFIEVLVSQEMAILNALPTAEGVIYNIIGDYDKCLVGAEVLVLGYGLCGTEIVNKLKALKSEVTVLEECELKKAQARVNGIKTIEIKEIKEHKFDIIINTIPIQIVDNQTLDKMDKKTLIFDIASAPFGFEEGAMISRGIRYKKLRGLPSKFGVRYSSENISSYIIKSVEGVVVWL